jgi:DNA-binding HxlR family transcriptional regulator
MQLAKLTDLRQSEPKRRYVDACGLAHALELIGERWSMLVLRELLLGPRRFSEMRADLPGISANVLTQRLSELEQRGLVRRRKLPPPASVQVYEATEWTLEASPILCELGRWASRSPSHDPSQPVSAVAILLSMRTNFEPAKAGDLACTIAFRFGPSAYFVTVADGMIAVEAGEPANADATITCHPDQLKPVLYGDGSVADLQVAGNVDVARRYFGLFSLPSKVDPHLR